MDNNNKMKRLPFDIEAEKGVISCMLQDNNCIDEVTALVTDEMFYDLRYKTLFKCIIKLNAKGFGIDKITLSDKASTITAEENATINKINNIRKSAVEEEGISELELNDDFFVEILNAAEFSSRVKDYCSIVKEKYLLRKTIDLCENVIINCSNQSASASEILNTAQEQLYKYAKDSTATDYVKLDQIVYPLFKIIDEASKTPDGITGIKTGFRSIDQKTSGIQNSNMIIIGARPGEGKTSFALNLAYNMSNLQKKNVIYFSLEMAEIDLAMRILALQSGMSSANIKSGRVNEDIMKDLFESAKIIINANLYFNADAGLTIPDMRNKCQKLDNELRKKGEKLDAVFIDYLQLMHSGGLYKDDGSKMRDASNRQEEVSEISRQIKRFAMDLKIPIIALSQLSREVEKTKGEPRLSDIRESGSIEQDADIVMLLHRAKPEEEPFKTSVIFAKNRHGNTDTVYLRFDRATSKFAEFSYSE